MPTYSGEFKIIVFGDEECGKTSIIKINSWNIFKPDSKMTIGVEFNVKDVEIYNELGEKKYFKLNIWEFRGEERFKFLLPTYVSGASGGLFVYDITNLSSLASIDNWLAIVRKHLPSEMRFPILMVGTKADLEHMREVSVQKAIDIAKSHDLPSYIECSGKTGKNVEKVFQTITELMVEIAFL